MRRAPTNQTFGLLRQVSTRGDVMVKGLIDGERRERGTYAGEHISPLTFTIIILQKSILPVRFGHVSEGET